MSLSTALPEYNLGIFASKDFDSRDLLDDTLGPKLAQIRHLYTNGVNPLIAEWALVNGVTHTVFPVSGGRGLPASTRDIVDASEVVLIIASTESKSAAQAAQACVAKAQREAHFKWRQIPYEPILHWREKLERVSEIVAAMELNEREASPLAKAIWEVAG